MNASHAEEKLYNGEASDDELFDFIQNIFVFDKNGIPPDRERVYKLMRAEKILEIPKNFENCKFPTGETQTIIRWLNENEISSLRVILLPSETEISKLNAHATCVCIEKLKYLFPNTNIILSRKPDAIIPLQINVDERQEFLSSISRLFKVFDAQLEEAGKADEEVIICSTGGFKAVSAFAMMYAQINSLPCLYTFETSANAYEVMNIPLGYAYTALDEEINMLKAIQNMADFDVSILPQWVQDSKEIAGTYLSSYKKAREKPYGTGEALFNRLRSYGKEGSDWADYLQDLLIHNWSQIWAGDQIPETVEHSRRHSKRLMEFTANLFRCAEKKLEAIGFNKEQPEMLALLIASIYLHDIGHTALSYPSVASGNVFPLGMFPSVVREVHHLLTGFLLRSNKRRYFGECEKAEILVSYVPLIAEYHRGYTTLKNNEANPNEKIRRVGELLFGKEDFARTLQPLEKRCDNSYKIQPEYMLNLAALMRIIDGCDVQADRVISSDYLEYRRQRGEDEIKLLSLQLHNLENYLSDDLRKIFMNSKKLEEHCSDIYSLIFRDLQNLKDEYNGSWSRIQKEALSRFMALSLANRIVFKSEQYIHFSKHQHVGFVIPVLKHDDILIKVFPNTEFNDSPENFRITLESVCKDIDKEYSLVKDVLSNKLAFKAELTNGGN